MRGRVGGEGEEEEIAGGEGEGGNLLHITGQGMYSMLNTVYFCYHYDCGQLHSQ